MPYGLNCCCPRSSSSAGGGGGTPSESSSVSFCGCCLYSPIICDAQSLIGWNVSLPAAGNSRCAQCGSVFGQTHQVTCFEEDNPEDCNLELQKGGDTSFGCCAGIPESVFLDGVRCCYYGKEVGPYCTGIDSIFPPELGGCACTPINLVSVCITNYPQYLVDGSLDTWTITVKVERCPPGTCDWAFVKSVQVTQADPDCLDVSEITFDMGNPITAPWSIQDTSFCDFCQPPGEFAELYLEPIVC